MTLATRLAVAMIALVAIAISAVGWLSYRNVERTVLPRVLERIEAQSRLGANEIELHVLTGRGDIAAFQGLAAVTGLVRARLNGGIDPVDHTTEAVWRERLEGAAGRPDGPQAGLFASLDRRRGRPSGNRSHRSLGTGRRRSHRAGSRAEANRRRLVLSGNHRAFPRSRIRFAGPLEQTRRASSRPRRCRSCRSQCRSSRTAESGSVSSLSMQICGPCSTAFGLRCGRMRACTWSMTKAATSFILTVTENSARNWEGRPTGKATSPTWLPRSARRKSSRAR